MKIPTPEEISVMPASAVSALVARAKWAASEPEIALLVENIRKAGALQLQEANELLAFKAQ